jgi:adenylyltransferase/sulfurtransferase
MLSNRELSKYDRQLAIRGFTSEGQEKLKRARILIAGAGGLGSSAALYLAAAGIGTIRMVDYDRVELSNLNRQVLHWDDDVGRSKVESAREKLEQLNRDVAIEAIAAKITETNISKLLDGFDLIVDAMDNLQARYLLNRAALSHEVPLFHGAVYGFEGRAMTVIPGRTACLRCVYRGAVPGERFPVIGVAPAVIGCIQATEVIKYVVGLGELLTNKLLIYDGTSMEFNKFEARKDPDCQHCGHPEEEIVQ